MSHLFICSRCNTEKPQEEFAKQKRKTGTYYQRHFCKACDNERRLKYYYANREKELARIRAYEKDNLKKVSTCNRNKKLKDRYGITLADYIQLVTKQNSKCAICQIETTKLFVDHCHTTGNIRELLCHGCNTGIGLFKENKTSLQNAIQYLNKHDTKTYTPSESLVFPNVEGSSLHTTEET